MANETIHDQALVTSADAADEIALWVVASGIQKRIAKANFIGLAATGGGTIATGGFTLTVPATGTAALLGTAQTFSALKTFSANIATPVVQATSAAGLALQDDGGNPGLVIEDGGRVNIGNQSLNQRQTYSRHTAYGTAVISGGTIFRIVGVLTNYRYTLLRVTFTQHTPTTNLNNHFAAVALINIANHSAALTAAVLSHELIKNRKIAVAVSGTNWNFRITDAADADVVVETYHSITVEMFGWLTGPSTSVEYPVFYP